MQTIKTYLQRIAAYWQFGLEDTSYKLRRILQPVNELASIIDTAIYEDDCENGLENSPTSENEGFSIIQGDINYTFYHFSYADDHLSDSEVEAYHQIEMILGVADLNSIALWRSDYKYRQSYRAMHNATKELYQEHKEILCLWYLRNYDKQHNTSYLEKARIMLFELATLIVKADGEVTSPKKAALASFKILIWWQNCHIEPNKYTNKLRQILSPVDDLAFAIESVQWSHWKPVDEDGDKQTPPNGKELLNLDISSVVRHICSIGNTISDKKIELQFEIENILGCDDPYTITYWRMIPKFRKNHKDWQNNSAKIYQSYHKPISAWYLLEYDKQHNTDCLKKAQAMLVDLATIIMESDGKIDLKGNNKLTEFKNILLEQNNKALSSNKSGVDVIFNNETTPSTQASMRIANFRDDNKTHDSRISLEELLDNLDSLIGLDSIKSEVMQLVNFLKMQQLRKARGMETIPISRHLVFYGNPGTGKTTIARLLARIYKSLNVISSGHLIETDRAGLVAGYIGQTAIKTQEVVRQAIGGVLFIDEAYTLAGEGQDFGREAIDTLIKMMEDNRDDLIVIVAGYTDEMSRFLSSNPGLKSRFNKYFYFEDYDAPQLVSIFELFCRNADFNLSNSARAKLLKIFESHYAIRDKAFGNARLARNIFEHTINNQANRVIALADITDVDLITILDVDIPDV